MQLVRPKQGMRCIMESVHQDYSHGSRFINAWHAEGAQWELSGEDEPKVLFWIVLLSVVSHGCPQCQNRHALRAANAGHCGRFQRQGRIT